MAMQLVESHVPEMRFIGLKCINFFIKHQHPYNQDLSCFQILKSNSYDQLIYVKLRNLLYKAEILTFDLIMEIINIILLDDIKRKENGSNDSNPVVIIKETLTFNQKYNEVLLQLLDNIIMENDSNIVLMQINAIQTYFLLLGKCHLLKFSSSFLKIINFLLEKICFNLDSNLSLCSLNFTYEFLFRIKCQINVDDFKSLLTNLCKLIIKMQISNDNQNDLDEIIEKIFVLFENAPSQSIQYTLTLFCTKMIKTEILWKHLNKSKWSSYFLRNADGVSDIGKCLLQS